MRVLAVLFVLLALSGCAGQASVAKQDNFDLCRSATIGELVGRDSVSHAEVLKRGLIKESEWPIMVDRRLEVGMSECAALAILRGGASVTGVNGPYKFGGDNTIIINDYDPRVPPASYTDYMKRRASEVCYSPGACYAPPIQPTQQKYVPKYLLTLKNGKVTECKSVNFAKIGTTSDNAELFTLPCMKDVPGFKK